MRALELVLAGGIYIPQEILAREETPSVLGTRFGVPSPAAPSDLRLTDRQVEVLALVMQGKSNKAICRLLNLAEPTVKNPYGHFQTSGDQPDQRLPFQPASWLSTPEELGCGVSSAALSSLQQR
jgi:hypothetical protein